MTLGAVKDWLKGKVDVGSGIEVGGINGDKEKCIGVYGRAGAGQRRICVGGADSTYLQYRRVAVLVHWTKSVVAAEQKAWEVYRVLGNGAGTLMDGWRVVDVDPGESPIPVGKDQRGISEWVINATISYERMN